MDMGFISPRLSKMETGHLCFTAPVGPPIPLQAPDASQGDARYPAPRIAYGGMQLL